MSHPNNIRARRRLTVTRTDGLDVVSGSDPYDIAIDSDLVHVRTTIDGRFTADVDLDELKATVGTNLYVSPGGSNSNTGLSWAQAYRSIWKAIISMDTGSAYGSANIYVRAGTYDYTNGFQGLGPGDDSFNMYGVGGRVRATTSRLDLSWALVGGGTPDVYRAALTNAPYSVVDDKSLIADTGLGSRLTLRADAAAVQAAPGSYVHTGGFVYVRTSDSRAPDSDLHVFEGDGAGAGIYNMLVNSASVVAYFDGVEFIGGEKAAYMLNGTRMTLVDCAARYADSEGIRTHIADCYAVRCRSQENGGDGFAYTSTAGSRAVEVDCVGSNNGYGVLETSNGSTMHNAGVAIRVNGTYQDTKGPNVADVNGTTSVNLNCTVGGTRATIASQQVGFYCDGTMTIASCTIDSSELADDIYAEGATDNVYVTNTTYVTTGGSGTVQALP